MEKEYRGKENTSEPLDFGQMLCAWLKFLGLKDSSFWGVGCGGLRFILQVTVGEILIALQPLCEPHEASFVGCF